MKQLYIQRLENLIEMVLESNLLNSEKDLKLHNLLTLILLELKKY